MSFNKKAPNTSDAKLKASVADRISKKFNLPLSKKDDSSFENDQKGYRLFVRVSQKYGAKFWCDYWYTYYSRNIHYLNGADNAYFVLTCRDTEKVFAIPKSKLEEIMSSNLDENHVYITVEGGKHYIHVHKENPDRQFALNEFEI